MLRIYKIPQTPAGFLQSLEISSRGPAAGGDHNNVIPGFAHYIPIVLRKARAIAFE
jgi:hypothetical protein